MNALGIGPITAARLIACTRPVDRLAIAAASDDSTQPRTRLP
jgi:hypothetical protein